MTKDSLLDGREVTGPAPLSKREKAESKRNRFNRPIRMRERTTKILFIRSNQTERKERKAFMRVNPLLGVISVLS